MRVSVFPDSSGLTLKGLNPIDNLKNLKSLSLHGMSANVVDGQGQRDFWKWALEVLRRVKTLVISGELQRHIHTLAISALHGHS